MEQTVSVLMEAVSTTLMQEPTQELGVLVTVPGHQHTGNQATGSPCQLENNFTVMLLSLLYFFCITTHKLLIKLHNQIHILSFKKSSYAFCLNAKCK